MDANKIKKHLYGDLKIDYKNSGASITAIFENFPISELRRLAEICEADKRKSCARAAARAGDYFEEPLKVRLEKIFNKKYPEIKKQQKAAAALAAAQNCQSEIAGLWCLTAKEKSAVTKCGAQDFFRFTDADRIVFKALARALKKVAVLEHTSLFNGKVSSYYFTHNGTTVRLSNHFLPQYGARISGDYQTAWVFEVVVNGVYSCVEAAEKIKRFIDCGTIELEANL